MAKSSAKVQFKIKENVQKLERAFRQVNEKVLPQQFAYEFNTAKWDWPSETVRRNGSRVVSPRSISDTHGLEDSYERRRESTTRYSHVWRARHALIVALGAVLKNGTVVEGRDWTEEPKKHFRDEFIRAYRSLS